MLPAVARAKIGAALRAQPWDDGHDDALTDAADSPCADGSPDAASQPGAFAAAAAGAAAAAAVTAAMAAAGGGVADAACRAAPAAPMATGGARPRAGGGTAAPRRRRPSNSLAALREWRNGLSHREPRRPQRAHTVNV